MKVRITLGIAGALIALTVSFVAFAGAPGAVATDGLAVKAGQTNTETVETVIHNTEEATTCVSSPSSSGLAACGFPGLYGEGASGVYGESSGVGAVQGVFGFTDQAAGWGVRGRNAAGGGAGAGVEGQGGVGGQGEGQVDRHEGLQRHSPGDRHLRRDGTKQMIFTSWPLPRY